MQVVRRVVIVVVMGSVSDRDCNGGSDGVVMAERTVVVVVGLGV